MKKLSDFTKPDGTVPLYHFTAETGKDELELDPNRFGQNPWTKADAKVLSLPRTLFYLDPADREHYFTGSPRYETHYPAGKIYDVHADPKRIVERIAARPPFSLAKVIKIVRRLGYHGIYFAASFPTVAMFKPIQVRRSKPHKLARLPQGAEDFHRKMAENVQEDTPHLVYADYLEEHGLPHTAAFVRQSVQGGHHRRLLNHDAFSKSVRNPELDGRVLAQHAFGNYWMAHHTPAGIVVYSIPESANPHPYYTWNAAAKETHEAPEEPTKLARGGYGYCPECKAPYIRHDKENKRVHCPNGHSKRYIPTYKIKLARLENTSDVSGMVNAIRSQPPQPMYHHVHSILADALDDAGDPRGEIVRHAVSGPEGDLESPAKRWMSRLREVEALTGLDTPAALQQFAWPRVARIAPGGNDNAGPDALYIRHAKGPKGEAVHVDYSIGHDLEVSPNQAYTSYDKAFTLPDFHRWLDQFDPDEKARILQRMQQQGISLTPPEGPTKLARLEPDSNAAGLHAAASDHTNPLDRTPHLVYADYLEEHGFPETAAFIRHTMTKKYPYVEAFADQDFHLSHGPNSIRFQQTIKGYPTVVITAPDGIRHLFYNTKYDRPAGERLAKELADQPQGPTKLAATRAPSGGTIVNSQFHQGGQFLPRAFKRIGRVIRDAVRYNRLQALKLSRGFGAFKRPDSYLDVGHEGENNDAWAMHNGSDRIRLASEAGVHPDEFHGNLDLRKVAHSGRVDHDKKAVSLVSSPLAREGSREAAIAELRERFPGYTLWHRPAGEYGAPMQKVRLARDDEGLLSPEEQNIGTRSASDRRKLDKMLNASTQNLRGTLPTMKEIKALATAGESTRGQYQHAGQVLTDFIGHDNARLFVAANAILSPLAKWEEHSRAAMRAVRLWREAGSPRDPATVAQIVARLDPTHGTERTHDGKKLYASVGWATKAKKLQQLFTNPEAHIQDIRLVADPRRGKIVDFGRAFFDPTGVPIDTHMGKAIVPTVEDVRAKSADKKGFKTKLDQVRAVASDTPVAHRLAEAIGGTANPYLHAALLDAQKKVVGSDITYKAYKLAIGRAAKELGWEPREVQETLWTAVVSAIAAKNLGVPTNRILDFLRHEDAFQAWNVGGLLSTPEVLGDVGGLTSRSTAAFATAADRPPSVTGAISPSDRAAYEAAVARIPPGKTAGAWAPIQKALASKLRRGRVPSGIRRRPR